MKSFTENTFNSDLCVTEARMPHRQSHSQSSFLWLWNEDVFSGWGRKHSWGVVMRSQKRVVNLRWPFHSRLEWNTVLSIHPSQLPVVWLSLSLSDCLPALMQAQVLPPFLHEMPCALACTRWSGPPPDSRCQGATSVPPGRCLFHTHLSPGSQRSAYKWKQEVE